MACERRRVCQTVPAAVLDEESMDTVGNWARAAQFVLAGAGIAAVSAPARVHACSCDARPIARSEPGDGAIGVTVDIAPILGGWFDPQTVAFEHEDGTPVAFDLRTGVGLDLCDRLTGELVPATALAANSRYLIRASAPEQGEGGSTEVSFTTGAERVAESPLSAPSVAVSFVRGNLIVDSCTSDVRGCLTVTGADHAELRLTRGGREQNWTFVRGTVELNTLTEAPECIEVRARDAAGRRSAVTALCGGDVSIRETRESDYEGYELRCENGVIGDGDEEPMESPDAGPDGGTRSDARHGSRSEIDMSEGGCSASGSCGSRVDSHALLLALLLGLRSRARYRNV
jgi:hypothetical protein